MMFTVAIPAFKGKFLHEAIASVLDQTYEDFELVIVDDCSPDNLSAIVSAFRNPGIRYYCNERNCGAEHVVDNWNRCLSYAHGDYLICMGDDDRMLPNCLADLANIINKYPNLDIYYSRTQLIDESSVVIKTFEKRPEWESVYEMIWNRWHGGSMFIGDYCYRTAGLRKRGGFYKLPFAWGSDAISAYEAGRNGGIANTADPGFQYRINRLSISSHSGNVEGKVNALLLERGWFESFFAKKPTNERDQQLLNDLQLMFRSHFVHMLSSDIIYAIHKHPFSQIPFWVKRRETVGLRRMEMLKCIIHGLFGI